MDIASFVLLDKYYSHLVAILLTQSQFQFPELTIFIIELLQSCFSTGDYIPEKIVQSILRTCCALFNDTKT
jgi:hypothetical protein